MTSICNSSKTSTAFLEYPATKRLQELAKRPYDLTKKGALNPERIHSYVAKACGYKFLYGTQRVDDFVIDALYDLAKEANVLEKMNQMQSGAVMNCIEGYPSDNRAVLHTAMRDLFDDTTRPSIVDEAVRLAKQEHEKLQKFLKRIEEEDRFDTLVVVGIGGSNLGPESLYSSLDHLQRPDRKVFFLSNIDPDDPVAILSRIDLSRTLVAMISKSGTTLETITNESFLASQFKKAGLKIKEHFVTVSAKGSPMDDENKYLACFHAWDFVGGRFSATAIYGGISLSFGLGYETFLEVLRGAHAMDLAAKSSDRKENLPLLLALLGIWNHNFLSCPTTVIVPYSYALRRFSAHVQQVDMESNGKQIDRKGNRVDFETGPIVWGEPGTNAQHSFFQLIHQGTSIVPLEIIGFRSSQRGEDVEVQGTTSQEKLIANWVAQAIALAEGKEDKNPNKRFEGNRPSSLLIAEKLTPYTMGALFALYEHKVAFQGFIWDINSFDQEGVQLGKELGNQVLESILNRKEGGGGNYPVGDAFLDQLESL